MFESYLQALPTIFWGEGKWKLFFQPFDAGWLSPKLAANLVRPKRRCNVTHCITLVPRSNLKPKRIFAEGPYNLSSKVTDSKRQLPFKLYPSYGAQCIEVYLLFLCHKCFTFNFYSEILNWTNLLINCHKENFERLQFAIFLGIARGDKQSFPSAVFSGILSRKFLPFSEKQACQLITMKISWWKN